MEEATRGVALIFSDWHPSSPASHRPCQWGRMMLSTRYTSRLILRDVSVEQILDFSCILPRWWTQRELRFNWDDSIIALFTGRLGHRLHFTLPEESPHLWMMLNSRVDLLDHLRSVDGIIWSNYQPGNTGRSQRPYFAIWLRSRTDYVRVFQEPRLSPTAGVCLALSPWEGMEREFHVIASGHVPGPIGLVPRGDGYRVRIDELQILEERLLYSIVTDPAYNSDVADPQYCVRATYVVGFQKALVSTLGEMGFRAVFVPYVESLVFNWIGFGELLLTDTAAVMDLQRLQMACGLPGRE